MRPTSGLSLPRRQAGGWREFFIFLASSRAAIFAATCVAKPPSRFSRVLLETADFVEECHGGGSLLVSEALRFSWRSNGYITNRVYDELSLTLPDDPSPDGNPCG